MLGLIVQFALSWLLVWLFERNDLRVLGMRPSRSRLLDLTLFFLLAAVCCALGFLLKHFFGGLCWKLNPALSSGLLLNGVWWHLKSVMFEELIFRGVLLYILIRRFGVRTAIIVSAIAFGIYHWFSFGVIGNPVAMIITFLLTGSMGLLYAFAYARTGSLYAPAAIHLGWNLTQSFIFPDSPTSWTILRPDGTSEFRTDSVAVYLVTLLLPVGGLLVSAFGLLRHRYDHDRASKFASKASISVPGDIEKTGISQ